jgi:hypothetical protein
VWRRTQDALINLVKSAPHKHLLIADTNVLLQQIDVFEQKCPATSLLVVMQTVLQELRGLSLAVYRRVMALMKDESKSFIFYPNEQSADSVVHRLLTESDNDFNDRLIRHGAMVFHLALSEHDVALSDDGSEADKFESGDKKLGDSTCKAILLTNDVENRVSYLIEIEIYVFSYVIVDFLFTETRGSRGSICDVGAQIYQAALAGIS